MAYKLLQDYLSTSIINHCIMPYLFPSENDIKKNYNNVNNEFLELIFFSRLYIGLKNEYSAKLNEVALITLKNKYYITIIPYLIGMRARM